MGERSIAFETDKVLHLRSFLSSLAWTEFFVPELIRTRDAAVTLLVNPSLDRQKEMPDDFLRARIMVLEELLNLGPNVLAEWDNLDRVARQADEYEENVQERAELGHVAPLSDR